MRNNYFYMKVHQGGPLADFPEMIEANPTGFKQKYFRSAQWILSQYPKDATHSGTPSEGSCAGDYLDGRLIGKCEYDDLPESEKEEYTRGFLRIISASVRKMPGKNKKHELFIPYPERAENLAPMLNIERSALEKFYGLADELVELDKAKTINSPNERRPYTPLDTVERLRAERNSVSSVRLRDGHIVYFDINKEGNVCDISFSAIWRGAVKMNNNEESLVASMHDFFPAELRPYNSKRETISLAEWMFGFVEQRNIGTSIALGTSGDENGIARRAYSGRIRFSTARIDPKQKQGSISDYFVNGDVPYPNPGQKPDFAAVDYVALRELSSPKPPSPQLYFKRSNLEPRPIEKVELAPLRHVPQGRKMYLHIPSAYEDPDNCEGKPWLTGKDVADGGKRRCAVRPVRCRTVFWFHLDFDNLHKNELELLCFALQPSEAFRHKLGMGKSIGLGSVQIEPVALCLINRKSRYSEANSLFSPRRYSEVHFNSEQAISDLPDKYYLREKLCRTALSKEPKTPKYFAEIYRQRIQGTDTSKALELIGEPEHAKSMAGDGVEVCPPYSSGKEPWGEDDTYEWFANNDSHFNVYMPVQSVGRKRRLLSRRNLARSLACHGPGGR
jgi:CRISPR-associated protein (TIGR03986 family)